MIYKEKIKVNSNHKEITFHNVTSQVKDAVKKSGIREGIVVVYSHHTTCCVITQECAFDMSMTGLETLQQDVNMKEYIYIQVPKPLPLQQSMTRMPEAVIIRMPICVRPLSAEVKRSSLRMGIRILENLDSSTLLILTVPEEGSGQYRLW